MEDKDTGIPCAVYYQTQQHDHFFCNSYHQQYEQKLREMEKKEGHDHYIDPTSFKTKATSKEPLPLLEVEEPDCEIYQSGDCEEISKVFHFFHVELYRRPFVDTNGDKIGDYGRVLILLETYEEIRKGFLTANFRVGVKPWAERIFRNICADFWSQQGQFSELTKIDIQSNGIAPKAVPCLAMDLSKNLECLRCRFHDTKDTCQEITKKFQDVESRLRVTTRTRPDGLKYNDRDVQIILRSIFNAFFRSYNKLKMENLSLEERFSKVELSQEKKFIYLFSRGSLSVVVPEIPEGLKRVVIDWPDYLHLEESESNTSITKYIPRFVDAPLPENGNYEDSTDWDGFIHTVRQVTLTAVKRKFPPGKIRPRLLALHDSYHWPNQIGKFCYYANRELADVSLAEDTTQAKLIVHKYHKEKNKENRLQKAIIKYSSKVNLLLLKRLWKKKDQEDAELLEYILESDAFMEKTCWRKKMAEEKGVDAEDFRRNVRRCFKRLKDKEQKVVQEFVQSTDSQNSSANELDCLKIFARYLDKQFYNEVGFLKCLEFFLTNKTI